MKYIEVWCEYDFNGSFGGNNNEAVFEVDENMNADDTIEKVVDYLSNKTSLSKEDLEDLWDWEFIEIEELK